MSLALPRRIAHLDMDAFFASVELLRYPQLKGLPMVIGGERRVQRGGPLADLPLSALPLSAFARLVDYSGRGVISTATYAARQFGVGSAMALMKAARLCPQAIVLPVDFAEYERYSHWFKRIVTGITPVMEEGGIDEVYIDFTHAANGQCEGGGMLARALQQQITQATGLTCSIGAAPNKLLAKMASEMNKPNGMTVLYESDVQAHIWPLPCRKIHGIGPKTDARLHALGMDTIGALAAQPRERLIDHFGPAYGAWLHNAAWGRDDSPVVTESQPQSISRETTFERDLHALHDRAALGHVFTGLCQQVAEDLQRQGYVGRTIGIKLRYDDFSIATRAHTLESGTQDAHIIRRAAGLCLKRVPLARPLRLLGVRVGHLTVPQAGSRPPRVGETGSLF